MRDFRQIDWGAPVEQDCRALIRLAVQEDLDGKIDITTAAVVSGECNARAAIVARETGIIAGLPAVHLVLDQLAPNVALKQHHKDGEMIEAGGAIAELAGPAAKILTAERIALNFLGRLSGIATLTNRFVMAVKATKTAIYDTRKTTPGWRRMEKYAVGCGGGRNHRRGLDDAILIKDNHLALGRDSEWHGDPAQAVRRAVKFLEEATLCAAGEKPLIEIELDDLSSFDAVLNAGPDIILLDNMTPLQLREAVARRDALARSISLEASGGISLETVVQIAESGIDRISVGGLTHSSNWLDIGLDWLD